MEKRTYDPDWKEKVLKRDPLIKASCESQKMGMSYGQYQSYLYAMEHPIERRRQAVKRDA